MNARWSTSNGKPVAILAAVDESSFDETLAAFRKARAADAVAALRHGSVTNGAEAFTKAEIEAEIAAARKAQ